MRRLLLLAAAVVLALSSTYTISNQFHSNSFSTNDFSTWTVTGASIPQKLFSFCSGKELFGGYGVFSGDLTNPSKISKTWTSLIPHHSLRIRLALYKIDSWPTCTFFFQADAVTVKTLTFSSLNPGTSDTCGTPSPITDSVNLNYNEAVEYLDVTIAHSSPSLQLTMVSNLATTTGSWGIRELNLTMEACDESCLTCTNDSTPSSIKAACSSCDSANGMVFSNPLCACTAGIRQKNKPCASYPCVSCPAACTAGHYLSSITLECEPCHPGCNACTTPANSVSSCSSCSALGYFGVPACSSCYSGCRTCTSGSATNCQSCLYQYFLFSANSSCLTVCPQGYYGQEVTAMCYVCLSPCASCQAATIAAYFCTSCVPGFYLWQDTCLSSCPLGLFGSNGNCVSVCPTGTFADSASGTCLSCPLNCDYCQSSTACLVCSSGAFKLGTSCFATCPALYYGDSSSGLCLACDVTCSSCFGPSESQCLSCVGGVLVGSTCYTVCPQSTYSALCLPCDASCLTCSAGSPSSCLSCAAPSFYHLNDSTCLTACPGGDLADNLKLQCLRCLPGLVAYYDQCVGCSATCLTCFSPSFLECSSCESAYSLVHSTCLTQAGVIANPSCESVSQTSLLWGLLVSYLLLAVVLEGLFEYKTNLLLTLELLQMLSYTYYLSVELTQNTQKSALLLYRTNFSHFLSFSQTSAGLPSKFALIGKTGYFLLDTAGIHIILALAVLLLLLLKKLASRAPLLAWAYRKCNPYLITYTVRLLALEWSLSLWLFLYCFSTDSILGVASLMLVIVDAVLIAGGSCWRIRTEEDLSQVALIYNNEVGHKDDQVQTQIRANRILPSSLTILGKMPLGLTILLFVESAQTQTIALLAYSLLLSLLSSLLPYRRKVYRASLLVSSLLLLINQILAILVQKGANSASLDALWVAVLAIALAGVALQALVNYEWFYLAAKYGWSRGKEICGGKEGEHKNEESMGNLTEPQPEVGKGGERRVGPSGASKPSSYLQLTNSRQLSQEDVQLDLNL